jgi:hypothetical protein
MGKASCVRPMAMLTTSDSVVLGIMQSCFLETAATGKKSKAQLWQLELLRCFGGGFASRKVGIDEQAYRAILWGVANISFGMVVVSGSNLHQTQKPPIAFLIQFGKSSCKHVRGP